MGQGEQVPATLNGRSTGGPVVATKGIVSASRTPLVMSDSTAEFIPPPFSDSPPSPDVLSEEALEQLSAHLDGELSDEEDRQVLDLLAHHPQARLERRRLQEAWNLLDWLPRPHADAEFATRTLSRIHALDSLGDSATSSAHPAPSLGQIGSRSGTVLESTVRQGATNQARRQDMNRKRAWLLWPVALLVFLSVALISSGRLTHPADRLVRELEFVEWLDEYQAIQTVEQFQAMETLAPWDSLIGQAEPIGRAVFSDADALRVSDQSETNATDQWMGAFERDAPRGSFGTRCASDRVRLRASGFPNALASHGSMASQPSPRASPPFGGRDAVLRCLAGGSGSRRPSEVG